MVTGFDKEMRQKISNRIEVKQIIVSIFIENIRVQEELEEDAQFSTKCIWIVLSNYLKSKFARIITISKIKKNKKWTTFMLCKLSLSRSIIAIASLSRTGISPIREINSYYYSLINKTFNLIPSSRVDSMMYKNTYIIIIIHRQLTTFLPEIKVQIMMPNVIIATDKYLSIL